LVKTNKYVEWEVREMKLIDEAAEEQRERESSSIQHFDRLLKVECE